MSLLEKAARIALEELVGLEAGEEVLRTAHFTIGDNYDFDANGILHQYGLILRPTVTVDGRTIMQDGDILL